MDFVVDTFLKRYTSSEESAPAETSAYASVSGGEAVVPVARAPYFDGSEESAASRGSRYASAGPQSHGGSASLHPGGAAGCMASRNDGPAVFEPYVPRSMLRGVPPSHGVLNTDFVVDTFNAKAQASGTRNFVLTHFHADHYGSLNHGFSSGVVYCSPETARLVRLKLRVCCCCKRFKGRGKRILGPIFWDDIAEKSGIYWYQKYASLDPYQCLLAMQSRVRSGVDSGF